LKKNLLPLLKISKPLFDVFVGAGFDKGLIIIVSLFLVEYIGLENYGKWSVFYQFIIIGGNILINPQVALYKIKSGEQKFIIFDSNKLILSITFIALITLVFFDDRETGLFAFISIISLFIYQYLNTVHRFTSKTYNYTLNSGVRFFVFLLTFAVGLKFLQNTFIALVYSYVISLFIVIAFRHRYLLNHEFLRISDKKEYYLLLVYGLISTLSTGVDKLVLEKSNLNIEIIGLYAYVLSLANIPNFTIEVVYKTIQPRIFSSFRKGVPFTEEIKSQIKLGQLVIVLSNLIIPISFYYLSLNLGIISREFAANIKISWILASSFIMAVYSFYHFYNMKIIHNNSTGKLSQFMVIICCFYLLLFLSKVNNDISLILGVRFIVLASITLIAMRMNHKL